MYKKHLIIEPDKCIVEDVEILGFDNEEQMKYYSLWHEALVDRRLELNATSERELKIIKNELAKKRQLVEVSLTRKPTKSSTIKKPAPTPIPTESPATAAASNHQRQGSIALPSGMTILNSDYYNTISSSKPKYKLTKLYNKYRGRQLRRNFVNEKQRSARIEVEISKSYLNSWLAYTALQALQQQNAPVHLVYIDPKNIIRYSNRINPQQVAEYRQKSHLLPSSATSKKSSAASYDVYEIMEVLANTNKTHVTITRNANRPSQAGANTSIYSHSVNASTPGIVSTQLHLQARSYLDTMSKFYDEERQRLEIEEKEMAHEPSSEELIGRYLNTERSHTMKSPIRMKGFDK